MEERELAREARMDAKQDAKEAARDAKMEERELAREARMDAKQDAREAARDAKIKEKEEEEASKIRIKKEKYLIEDELLKRSVGQTFVAILCSVIGVEKSYNLYLRNKKEKKRNQLLATNAAVTTTNAAVSNPNDVNVDNSNSTVSTTNSTLSTTNVAITSGSGRPETPSATRIPLIDQSSQESITFLGNDSNPNSIETLSESVETVSALNSQGKGMREHLLLCFASCLGMTVSVQNQ